MKRLLCIAVLSVLLLFVWAHAQNAHQALCGGPIMPPWATYTPDDYPTLENPEDYALILDGFTVTPCIVHARRFLLDENHSVPPELLQWREDYQNAIYQVLFTFGFASLDEIKVRPHEIPFLTDDSAGVFSAELLTFDGGGVILLFWYTMMPPEHITLYIGVYPY